MAKPRTSSPRSGPVTAEPMLPVVDGSGGVRSVQRALDILVLLTEDRPQITVREIVEATGLAKTTALRLAQTLVQCGLLWATDSGYMAGPGLWRWAYLAKHAWELPPETQRMMGDMALEHQETVNLYIRRDIHRLCIAQKESPRALRHVISVGDELPLWAGASARVLLVGAPVELLARVVAGAPRGRTDLETLRSAVAETESNGFAVSHGERESGVSAVAVPVINQSGTVVSALSMSGSTARFTEDRIPNFVSALRSAAVAMAGRGLGNAFQGTA